MKTIFMSTIAFVAMATTAMASPDCDVQGPVYESKATAMAVAAYYNGENPVADSTEAEVALFAAAAGTMPDIELTTVQLVYGWTICAK